MHEHAGYRRGSDARAARAFVRLFFLERLKFYREASITLPKPSDPRYIEMADQNSLLGGGSGK